MSNQLSDKEVLEAVIQKAIDNGLDYWLHEGFAKYKIWQPVDMLELLVEFELGEHIQQVNYQHIIFNHDFARCLWPGWDLTLESAKFLGRDPRPLFHQHLKSMVVADDPIHYLREHALK